MSSANNPIPLLDLRAQYQTIKDEILDVVHEVLESQYFILGPEVQSLEEEIGSYSTCEFAIGVSSGTDALLASLMAVGIKPGQEVIVPAYTFFSTAGSVYRLGGKPVFVDIDPVTYNVDPNHVNDAISPATRAMIPVHLFGQMADMDELMGIAETNDIFVIEDAAQAIGAEYQGRSAGSIGHLGIFSFFPSKNLGAFGDGGMVVTNDSTLSMRVRMMRNHGGKTKYENQFVGGNFRLDALQAAVLRVKLRHLDSWTRGRQENASRYRKLFTDAGVTLPMEANLTDEKGITLPIEKEQRRHIYNQFVIRAFQRDTLKEYLGKNGIASEIYYPKSLHEQECFNDLGYKTGDFPESERAANETLALPIYPELIDSQQERIVSTIAEFYKSL
jgi:dTDP-4-amino-4,6-dideoxygalactose transaminase